MLIINYIKALRPAQWSKNAIIFAALIFALGDPAQSINFSSFIITCIAAILFSLLSSSVYLINDIKDINLDRVHPKKKYRPIASGAVPVSHALILSILLIIISLYSFFLLSADLFFVAFIYLFIQLIYTFILKNIALFDVFIIAIGFVLRAIAGAVAINVPISPWLLLCTLLLALFLALCKRRHEKVVLSEFKTDTRPALEKYNSKLLDQLISIVSSAIIVCYAIYTLWPDTVEKFNTNLLGLTIPFVIFGIFRYLDLVYRHEKGDRPEKILLTDMPIIICVFLYALTVVAILSF